MTQGSKKTARDLISTDVMLGAIKLVEKGNTYDLAEEIFVGMPELPGLGRFHLSFTHTPEGTAKQGGLQFSSELFAGTAHSSTHIDALTHIQSSGKIFGGLDASEARDDHGWQKHGAETIPPLVGRGVLLDVAKTLGVEYLEDGYEISIEELQRSLMASGNELQSGDIVLIRTGKIQQFSDPEAFLAGQPGIGRAAAIWLADQNVAIICSDTATTEPVPLVDPTQTAHVAMLVDRGVHLVENLNLEGLSESEDTVGLFIALPLKMRGATGSWIRPVLIT
ncbi:cyclase family protein [Ruegeria sp. EL01]|uniref:cyclase family protein n=1 Tax=Ruegeria sp. EL01 TaxID=2107578 RepID=UPI0013C512DD|nr:cyclase family protein [Ruegeria sp. EL01]